VFELLLRHLAWTDYVASRDGGAIVGYHRVIEGWGVSHWSGSGIRTTPPISGACILAVGDSFTAGNEVNDDQVFTALLQQKLRVRVANAGFTALSPADYVAGAASLRQAFRPVWTVIELNTSDLSDDSFVASKGHFEVRGSALVSVTPAGRPLGRISRVLSRLRRHSALANYGLARLDMFRTNASPPLFRAADASPPAPPPVREWPVEAELDAMARAYDHRVTFLFIPPFEGTPSDIERRFLGYCRNASVSCADLRDSFGAFRASGSAPFGFFNSRFGEGHMNAKGHEAAAELLARELGNLRRHGLF